MAPFASRQAIWCGRGRRAVTSVGEVLSRVARMVASASPSGVVHHSSFGEANADHKMRSSAVAAVSGSRRGVAQHGGPPSGQDADACRGAGLHDVGQCGWVEGIDRPQLGQELVT